jgi:hypothetical protein
VFFDNEESQLVDSPDTRTSLRNYGLLRRRIPFVALVNSKGELRYLVDRESLLERFAAHLIENLEAAVPSSEDRS